MEVIPRDRALIASDNISEIPPAKLYVLSRFAVAFADIKMGMGKGEPIITTQVMSNRLGDERHCALTQLLEEQKGYRVISQMSMFEKIGSTETHIERCEGIFRIGDIPLGFELFESDTVDVYGAEGEFVSLTLKYIKT